MASSTLPFPLLLPNNIVIACGNRCATVLKYKLGAEVAADNDSFLWEWRE